MSVSGYLAKGKAVCTRKVADLKKEKATLYYLGQQGVGSLNKEDRDRRVGDKMK